MIGGLLRRRTVEDEERNSSVSLGGFDQYLNLLSEFAFNGMKYFAPGSSAAISELSALSGASNPIVGGCISVRLLVFSEARFTWQRWQAGRPGEMFGSSSLGQLERPWSSATTGDLLARMEVDASLYGNSYWVLNGGDLVRLDPARMVIVTGAVDDPLSTGTYGQTLVRYSYVDKAGHEIATFFPDEIAHYAPLPDPQMPFRGRPWLHTIIPDTSADDQITTYKHAFLKNAATPNMVVSFDPQISVEAFKAFRESMKAEHDGARNAFKTLYLGAGAKPVVVGSNFNDLALKAVQGAGETRIAMAAGVPASILGISEGLAGSALNSGNYTAARRRFADGTMRPLWRSACGALETLVPPPDSGSRLWFDDRDIAFLQEDVMDAAEIESRRALTIESYVRAGFKPESAVEAVMTGDIRRLVHTGLYSVQLQPPGTQQPAQTPPAA